LHDLNVSTYAITKLIDSNYMILINMLLNCTCIHDCKTSCFSWQGWIQNLVGVRGGAKLTHWQQMRHLSLQTRMYGSMLLHKIFLLQLLKPPLCAPSSIVTIRWRLWRGASAPLAPTPKSVLAWGQQPCYLISINSEIN